MQHLTKYYMFHQFQIFRLISFILVFSLSMSVFADGWTEGKGILGKSSFRENVSIKKSRLHDSAIDKISQFKRDCEFIFFYSTNCQYCLQFEPVLKAYSDNNGISVKAFAIGDGVSRSFSNNTVVAQRMVDQFFGKGAKISVPTLFIMNKNNLHAYPVSSGALTYSELTVRMGRLMPRIVQNERRGGNV